MTPPDNRQHSRIMRSQSQRSDNSRRQTEHNGSSSKFRLDHLGGVCEDAVNQLQRQGIRAEDPEGGLNGRHVVAVVDKGGVGAGAVVADDLLQTLVVFRVEPLKGVVPSCCGGSDESRETDEPEADCGETVGVEGKEGHGW